MMLWVNWCLLLFCCFLQVFSENVCDHPCLTDGTCAATELSNTCYYIFRGNKKTWNDTMVYCKSLKLKMVKLPKEVLEIETLLKELIEILRPSSSVWLGGRAKYLSEWYFVNGVRMSNTKWKLDVPGKNYLKECGTVRLAKNKSARITTTQSCWSNLSFICRFDDWKKKPSLYLSDTPANWFEARSRCVSLGGDLLYVNSKEDIKDVLTDKLQSHKEHIWVGLTHWLWQWNDGEKNLHFSLRNGKQNRNKCLMMYGDGRWDENNCNVKMLPFCQGEFYRPRQTLSGKCWKVLIFILGGLLVLLIIVVVVTLLACLVHRHHKNQTNQAEENIYCDVIPTISGMVTQNPQSETATQVSNSDISEETEILDNPVYGSYTRKPVSPVEDFESDLEETKIEDNPTYGTVS